MKRVRLNPRQVERINSARNASKRRGEPRRPPIPALRIIMYRRDQTIGELDRADMIDPTVLDCDDAAWLLDPTMLIRLTHTNAETYHI